MLKSDLIWCRRFLEDYSILNSCKFQVYDAVTVEGHVTVPSNYHVPWLLTQGDIPLDNWLVTQESEVQNQPDPLHLATGQLK